MQKILGFMLLIAAVGHAANAPSPVMDCLYQVSNTNPVSNTELLQWATHAAVQSFDYSFDKLDSQLQALKSCYTEQGWLAFEAALQQSGNLAAIKTQQLTVNSQVEGQAKVNPFKTNTWKISLPLRVVYQNTQEKLTQFLTVEMLVTKKSATQLGIAQFIAAAQSNPEQLSAKGS